MSRREDLHYLNDIISACEKIAQFSSETNLEDFKMQGLYFDAIVRNFQVIGDASGKISQHFTTKHAHIPWYQMKAMRNFLVHEYFNIDPDTI